jgi:hypothetical protein
VGSAMCPMNRGVPRRVQGRHRGGRREIVDISELGEETEPAPI